MHSQWVMKVEHSSPGVNIRFIVTNLDLADDPQGMCDAMHCECEKMENRIKDQQLGLLADRASSSDFHANLFGLAITGSAYTLIEGMRQMALTGMKLPKAAPQAISLTLLEIGALMTANVRQVRLLMSRSWLDQLLFRRVAAALFGQRL